MPIILEPKYSTRKKGFGLRNLGDECEECVATFLHVTAEPLRGAQERPRKADERRPLQLRIDAQPVHYWAAPPSCATQFSVHAHQSRDTAPLTEAAHRPPTPTTRSTLVPHRPTLHAPVSHLPSPPGAPPTTCLTLSATPARPLTCTHMPHPS